ncbi:MAG TPA: hypothetical protein VFG23_10000 [Polyangia bacterium]|nr:hypothetical protein [Polyangia bacterium]
MKEPSRLRDEDASALERALLEAGVAYRSPPSARAKTLGALGLAGSATLIAGATQAAPVSAVAKLTWTKLLTTVSLVGVVAAVPVGYYAGRRHRVVAHVVAAHAVPIAPVQAVETPEPAPAAGGGPVVAEPAVAAASPTEHTHIGVRVAHARPETGPASVTLARELSSIDAARTRLARGDAEGALTQLDAYTRGYPRGRLALEAEVLRIDALDQSGRTTAARERAGAFLRRHPHSVLAARVRARLGD